MNNGSTQDATAPIPIRERQRLEALYATELLDAEHNERLDAITAKAAELTNCPMALLTLVDRQEIWFKSRVGISARGMSRQSSLCAHAIVLPVDEVLVVLDARLDQRFVVNAMVVGVPFIRFYAGVPLTTPDGHQIGALCVMDSSPRSEFTGPQRAELLSLANKANNEIRKIIDLKTDSKRDTANVHIGGRLQLIRIQRNLSAVDLAERIGVSTAEIDNMKNGRTRIPTPTLFTLSRLFDIPTTYFFRGL